MFDLWIKLTGCAALLAASVFYGRVKIVDIRRRMLELTAYLELVRYISDNIEHFMKPIPDIVSSFRNDYLESSGFLNHAKNHGLSDAWERADNLLGEEAVRLLSVFFSSVGGGYAADELKLCNYTEKRLASLLSLAATEAKAKERIYKTIPPLLAGSVVLILI